MATIGFKATDQNLHDDLDFDFDDFNFDVEEPKDDRHPIIKAMAPIGRGAREFITDSNNITRFVKTAMPPGYGQAASMAGDVKNEMKQLYNNAAKEIKPVKETAKSFLRKTLPSLDGKIPKALKKKLDEFSKEEEQWHGRQGDGREEQLGSLLTSIFEQKAKDEVRNRDEHNEREKIDQAFEQIRHRDQITQLDAIRLAVQSQAQYQNRVTFNVQKKQLELNYRTFWAMADLNKEQKRSNALLLSELKATRINTALPDFVKQTTHEKFKELMRNKFLDSTREGMFGGAQDYVRKFTKNLGDQALGKLRSFTTVADAAGGMADGAAGMMGDLGDMPGFNARDEIIAELTKFPLEMLADKSARHLSKVLGKNAKLRRGGSAASRFVNTVGDRLHERLTSTEHNWGNLEAIRELLANSLPSNVPDSKMQVDRIDTLHNPAPFNRSNAKSLNEVIPGLLARIHREIRILRTGNENAELITYDYSKNRFSTDKQMGKDLRAQLAGNHTDRANQYANSILNKIDRSKKLTDEQREKARQMLIEKAVTGESIDVKNVWNSNHWGGGADGEAIASSFNRYLRSSDGKLSHNDQSYKRQIDLMQRHRGIVGGLGDPRITLQQMVNTGQLDDLKKLGILDESNSINRKLYAQWLMEGNNNDDTNTSPVVTPGVTDASSVGNRRASRRRGTGRNSSTGALQQGSVNLRQFTNNPNAHSQNDDMVAQLRAINTTLRERGTGQPVQRSVESNVEKIVNILSSLDEKYEHASAENYAIFTAMLQRLREIRLQQIGNGSLRGSEDETSSTIPTGNNPRTRSFTSLWEHLKSKSEDGWEKSKIYAARAHAKGNALWDKYSPGMKRHAAAGKEAAGTALKDLRGKLQNYYGDVIVSGETYPRLRASLLSAGAYRDKETGRVITSLEDIDGDVVDADGNLIITLEEFYNSYVTGKINKRVRDLFSNVKKRLGEWKDGLQSYLPGAMRRMKARVSGFATRIKQLLPPYDVYVKTDMQRPLLYANMMKYEKYFSKHTGKVIRHPRDIDGPVIDESGNIVVSEDHIKEGLVDIMGDPAGPGAGRLVRKVMRKATHAWEMMRNAAVGLFGSIGRGLGNVGDYFKDFFAPFADMITNSRKTVTLLEQIHGLLDQRLPGKKKVRGDADGDGVRDGSIEDIHRKRKEAEMLSLGQGNTVPGQKGKAPEGGMGKLLSGLSGLFNKKSKEGEDSHSSSLLDDAGNIAEIADFLNGDGHHGERGVRGSKARTKAAKERLKRMKGAKPGLLKRMVNKLPGFGKSAAAAEGAAEAAGAASKGGRLARLAKWGAYTPELVMGAGGLAAGAAKPLMSAGGKILGAGARTAGKVVGALTGPGNIGRLARWGLYNTDIVRGIGNAAKFGLKGARYLPRALGAAGAAYSGYSAYQNLKEGNYGSAALDAGLGAAGLASTVGGLSGLAGMGGAVLGGLGAILASPLLVPGLAAAAVGTAGYMTFKYFSKTKATDMSKVRLAQYGIDPSDKDSADKVFSLEAMLEQYAQVKDGEVTVDTSKLDTKEIAKTFDISDKRDLPLFNAWYNKRFLPVWRRWLGELRKVKADAKLGSIESVIPGKDKLRMTESSVNALSEIYSYMGGWSQDHPQLAYGLGGVKQVLESVRMGLMKEQGRDGGPAAKVTANTSISALGLTDASKLAKKAKEDTANYIVKDKDGNLLDTDSMQYADLREKIVKGEVTVDVAVAVPKELIQTDSSRLDALTTIRYKAYGLTYMTADKVRMLSALEQFMADQFTGDTDRPKLTMSTDSALEIAGKVFGVPNGNGEHAERWKSWFNGRFLPVFTLWAGTVRQKTGKTKLIDAYRSFPMTEQAPLARAIIGAKGKNSFGAIVSVWDVTSNPWSDAYELNSDPDSTASNLEAIRQVADKVRLGEVSASNGKTHKTSKEVSDAEQGWFGSVKRTVGNWFGKDWSPKGEGAQAAGDTILTGNKADKSAKPLPGMGDALKFDSGTPGKYTDLPVPAGSGWSATRDLILKGAAMAGVDPKALIATIAVESSFNPNAAPSNPNLPSSAKGLGQHLDSSWMEDLQRDGSKFGIPNGTSQFDARASVLMTAARLKFNAEKLQKTLGRPPTTADLYMAHLMGLGGASKFLQAPEGAVAAEVSPVTAKQHPDYFYENGRPLTVKETYAKLAQKLAKRPAEFGVTETDMKSTPSSAAAMSTAKSGDTASTASDASSPSSGKPAISLSPLREPVVNANIAPKQSTPASNTDVSFTPQMPKVNATTAPVIATSSDLPRLNKTDTSLGNWGPTKSDMQQRDMAMSNVIAPKIDVMAGTLQESLTQHREGVNLLRQILQVVGNAAGKSATPDVALTQDSTKAKPVTTSNVPVPQRRNF